MTGSVHGDSFEELAAFLLRPAPDGCAADVVRECICQLCDGRRFEVQVAAITSAARRTCLDCGHRAFIADSVEWWDDAEVEPCACPCGEEVFAAAAGFALREPAEPGRAPDVRWVYVGLRCLACGQLGVYEDWKVDWGPSGYLLDQA